jgi:Ca2+-binding EF-hand superfamily protein
MMAVDHSLEMFRTGVGAGAGAGRVNAKDGYRFDGDVAEAGKDGFRANDNSPVTNDELEHAHRTIRQKIKTRFKTFRDGFRLIDEDGNGKVNKVEALRMLMIFNLTTVREKALVKLVDLMDINGDGIDYNEFTKWLMSESVHDMPSHHLQR